MLYLANILTQEPFDDGAFYNVVNESEKLIEGIPTLVIGWELAKATFSEANILDWKIDELHYWTFGSRVRRDRNESDIKKFKKLVFERIINSVPYTYFDIVTSETEKQKEFGKYLRAPKRKYVLITDGMVYVYSPSSGLTTGVSLDGIDYIGGDRKKFFSIIYSNPSNIVVKERDFISYQTRELLDGRLYIIPYLSSLDSENN